MTTRGHDRILAAAVAVLLVLGLIMVQSASGPESAEKIGDAWFYVKRQAIGVVGGVSLCLVAALVPYHWLKKCAWFIYVGVIIALLLLMVPGVGREGCFASASNSSAVVGYVVLSAALVLVETYGVLRLFL